MGWAFPPALSPYCPDVSVPLRVELHTRVIAAWIFSCCLLPISADANLVTTGTVDKTHYILLLNSFGKGDPWTDKQTNAFEVLFSAIDNVKLRIMYMDANWDPAPGFEALRSAYRSKYGDIHFDVIITTDEPALQFIAEYRNELFTGKPVIFSGITDITPEMISEISNITGVSHHYNFAASVGLIFRLQPTTEHVYVIDEGSADDEPLRKVIRDAVESSEKKLELKFITGLNIAALKQRLGSLPDHSVVYYFSFFNDKTERTLNLTRIFPDISAASNAPIYSLDDSLLGYGIVGGYLNSAYHLSETAAHLARQILGGIPAYKLPVIKESKHELRYMFDYRQLKRLGISLDLLPVDSVVEYEPDTIYYRIRNYIWLVTGVPILLVLYIGSLLFNIGKRKKAQQGLINIIEQSNKLLEIDSLEKFSLDIRNRLAKIVKTKSDIRLFKYAEPDTEFDVRKLHPIAQADDAGSADRPQLEPEVLKLIGQAVEEKTCVNTADNLVVFFDKEDIPLNIAHLKAVSWIDDIDLDLVTLLAGSVTMAIGNLEKYHLLESLQTAHKIQESMLSKAFTEVCSPYGTDLHAMVKPAKEVGGDLYDFFAIDRDRLCVLVGDVSDKGVPAALFMVMAKTLIRSAAKSHGEPDGILVKVNDQLCRDNDMSMFVTVFLAVFNRVSGALSFANGGHNPPYIMRRDGHAEALDVEDGIALGVMEGMEFQRQTTRLDTGDALFVYSDGITEAMDVNGEMFGEQRLGGALARLSDKDAAGRVQGVLKYTRAFTEGAAQSDDITLLCLRRPGPDHAQLVAKVKGTN